LASQTKSFTIAPLGRQTIYQDFEFPQATGDFLLRAIVEYQEYGAAVSTQSRRRIKLVQKK
jgi:hypothetical protein